MSVIAPTFVTNFGRSDMNGMIVRCQFFLLEKETGKLNSISTYTRTAMSTVVTVVTPSVSSATYHSCRCQLSKYVIGSYPAASHSLQIRSYVEDLRPSLLTEQCHFTLLTINASEKLSTHFIFTTCRELK